MDVMSNQVWVDTDAGIDDALALLYLVGSGATVIGVSSVAGNTTAPQAAANAATILRAAGSDAPVHVGRTAARPKDAGGRHGRDGLGNTGIGDHALVSPGDGVDALLAASRRHAGMDLLAIGPATNLAAALAADPTLPDRLGSLVLMAGSGIAARDTNTWSDGAATRLVLDAYADRPGLTVVTLAATFGAALRGSELESLTGSTRWGGIAGRLAETYSALQSAEAGEARLIPHDAFAAAVLLHPGLAAEITMAGGAVVGGSASPAGDGHIAWVHRLDVRSTSLLISALTRTDQEG
jgi:purine nucleosidase